MHMSSQLPYNFSIGLLDNGNTATSQYFSWGIWKDCWNTHLKNKIHHERNLRFQVSDTQTIVIPLWNPLEVSTYKKRKHIILKVRRLGSCGPSHFSSQKNIINFKIFSLNKGEKLTNSMQKIIKLIIHRKTSNSIQLTNLII